MAQNRAESTCCQRFNPFACIPSHQHTSSSGDGELKTSSSLWPKIVIGDKAATFSQNLSDNPNVIKQHDVFAASAPMFRPDKEK